MKGKEKILLFKRDNIKVHMTLVKTTRYPTGKFQNGYIIDLKSFDNGDYSSEYVEFQDDVEGKIRVFLDDIIDVEEYKVKNEK